MGKSEWSMGLCYCGRVSRSMFSNKSPLTIFSAKKNEVKFEEKILVPFCVESALSGVMKRVQADQLMIYQKSFQVKDSWRGKRVRINFEAVDYEATVFVNNVEVGSHSGGTSVY